MTFAFIFAAASTLLATPPTIAWSGAGWYQTESTASDYRIVSGPFASKALCLAGMHPDTSAADYRCYDIAVRPSWEK
jgi:hypothetical protein